MSSTQAKSRSSLVGTFVTLAFVLGIGALVMSRIPADDDVSEVIVLRVTFAHSPRMDYPVHVTAVVEGVTVVDELITHSPGVWTITVPKGQDGLGPDVYLYANQPSDGELHCIIEVNKRTVDFGTRDTKGQLTCHRVTSLKPGNRP